MPWGLQNPAQRLPAIRSEDSLVDQESPWQEGPIRIQQRRTNNDPETVALAVTAVRRRSSRMHHSITDFTLVTYVSCVTMSIFHPTFIFRAPFERVSRAGQKAK